MLSLWKIYPQKQKIKHAMFKISLSKLSVLALSLFIVSCGKTEAPKSPADAVLATFKALEAQDSAAFIASLSQDKRDVYSMNPQHVNEILSNWKGNHAEMKILSIKQNDSTAMVMYNLAVTGREPHSRDSVCANVCMESGEWKNGY
jgi:hypothetical protein